MIFLFEMFSFHLFSGLNFGLGLAASLHNSSTELFYPHLWPDYIDLVMPE